MELKNAVRTIVIPDLHCPFQDNKAVELLIKIIRYKKPERIVYLGDVVDFYALSTYDKNPKRAKDVQDDLDEWYRIAQQIQKAAPDATRYFVDGNHEDRLRRYVWRQAPALHDFVKLRDVLRLTDFGVKPMGKKFFLDGILFTHGSLVSPYSSYTAKREHDKHGCSGISGHTHRFGKYERRLERGIESWHECGCLCNLNPEYVELPNWHQGFAVITTFTNRDSFHVNLVEILPGYKAIIDGKIYAT